MATVYGHGEGMYYPTHGEEPEIMDSAEEDNNEEIMTEEAVEHLSEPEPREEEADSDCSEESSGSIDPAVKEDMEKFQASFEGISEKFRLINRIGEGTAHPMHTGPYQPANTDQGTFSTVYKAEDLNYNLHANSWDWDEQQGHKVWQSPTSNRRRYHNSRRRPKYVAIKQIYVTSSPARILNELALLHDLRDRPSVCPLITAYRNTDQVVAVLPYFKHTDFREYFRQMNVDDMKIYFRSLFTALEAVHDAGILHRDIKPTNFLYEPTKRRGVLVDFGLAEREGTDSKPCICTKSSSDRRKIISSSAAALAGPSTGYPKADPRPSRRANRAGTRGFRAPEVLFKCTQQTTKIDIWSAGVILLTILSRRFPFFNSADDVEAMIEIATIFGSRRMKATALLHGTVFESSIPTIGQQGFSLEKIILWSTCRTDDKENGGLDEGEKLAVQFLERCLDLDPTKRISAAEALQHPFLADEPVRTEEEEEDDELHML
jgi:cell division control protein 7